MKGRSQDQIKWNEQYHKIRKEGLLDEFSKLQKDSRNGARKVMIYWARLRNPSGVCWIEGALFLLFCTESLLMSSHNIWRPIKPDTCKSGNKWALGWALEDEKNVSSLSHVQRVSIFWSISHEVCAHKMLTHNQRFKFALCSEKISYSPRNCKENNNFTTTKHLISV